MKFLIFTTFLTLAVFANIAKADNVEMESDEQKQLYADTILKDLEENVDKKCIPSLKKNVFPLIRDATVKHFVRLERGKPIYADEGREFELLEFVQHSADYKKWEQIETKCAKSFMKGVGKALKSAYNKVKSGLTDLGNKFKNFIKG